MGFVAVHMITALVETELLLSEPSMHQLSFCGLHPWRGFGDTNDTLLLYCYEPVYALGYSSTMYSQAR